MPVKWDYLWSLTGSKLMDKNIDELKEFDSLSKAACQFLNYLMEGLLFPL
jgi:hypothetical protein